MTFRKSLPQNDIVVMNFKAKALPKSRALDRGGDFSCQGQLD